MSGTVYLVGAGPGDVGLVTVKGMELIRRADCILYDRLVSPQLLQESRRDCERIYVGKANQHHTLPQQEINVLLAEKAREYSCVVRLKGGDVYVFGRGGEEALYLREQGIPFVIVPGVSSAIGGAAYAGIPVTHRGVATGFRVITAHNRFDETTQLTYSSMLDESETLVFLMGLGKVGIIAEGLMDAGRSKDTPVAVISHATTARQRVCVGTLQNIARLVREADLTSPAMILVGKVVAFREVLNFFESRPLWGKRYLLPKIGEMPSVLGELLGEQGADVEELQVGSIEGIPEVYESGMFADADWMLFTSSNGVEYFFRNLFASGLDVRSLAQVRIGAVGQKTAETLMQYGLRADLVPEKANGAALAEALHAELSGNKTEEIWYICAAQAGSDVERLLKDSCKLRILPVYENRACILEEPVEKYMEHSPEVYDGILFTCASNARRFMEMLSPGERVLVNKSKNVYSIGPSTSRQLEALGITVQAEADSSDYEGLVDCVLKNAKKKG